MTHISVPTGEAYEVILGKGLLNSAGERLKKMLDPETAPYRSPVPGKTGKKPEKCGYFQHSDL